jgi:hypothetical protein
VAPSLHFAEDAIPLHLLAETAQQPFLRFTFPKLYKQIVSFPPTVADAYLALVTVKPPGRHRQRVPASCVRSGAWCPAAPQASSTGFA